MSVEKEKTENGLIQKISDSAKKNPFAQMAVCCLLPVILIVVLKLLGFTGFWVYGLALVVCIGSHLLMAHHGAKGEKACH